MLTSRMFLLKERLGKDIQMTFNDPLDRQTGMMTAIVLFFLPVVMVKERSTRSFDEKEGSFDQVNCIL